ncbi:glutamate racemase [Yinghuangia soli]|uniref:Aspartate/glutamate racemase family protein n=1 Tax=Yinghuangia soli TaxID=2908204 RepID=A0AA41PWL9_9ACTN|nr:aspartate/glutamate racemase family protein [Yinghuangia soli]MCF2527179.1 aspartate/glutamate racemase family protein [Yinghuangia soli]
MTVALIDSGIGLLPTAGWLRWLAPSVDLLLLLDPDGMPWGSKSAQFITERLLAAGEIAVERGAQALVVPCNTATVTAIDALRESFEPGIPVIGTVPAIKPAASAGAPIAVWATVRTTESEYQQRLVAEHADGVPVFPVACPGLAEAVDCGDRVAIVRAVAAAVEQTPRACSSVVLGCTHYPLVADQIMLSLPDATTLYDSAEAVARQTLRRLDVPPGPSQGPGRVNVVVSGRAGVLPPAAQCFPVGRALMTAAAMPLEFLTPATSVRRLTRETLLQE